MNYYVEGHPSDIYLKHDRLPHVWCQGCGLGIVLSAYLRALTKTKTDTKKLAIVSGIGCTGRIAGYINFDAFHTLHCRAIPFATGLKLAKPELNVHVISGDGDLFAIGGNHFIHAARRNHDLLVVCVNNFNYAMTGGQMGPTTNTEAITTTSPYGNIETPFNLPFFAISVGAVYVARWTVFHTKQLSNSIAEAIGKRGFRFIEIISPCPTNYGKHNKLKTGLESMKFFRDNSEVKNFEDPSKVNIGLNGKIIIGKFYDIEKECYEQKLEKLKLSQATG